MRAVVVYESMYGNTHLVADAIGDGLRAAGEVVVVPVDSAGRELVEGADLVIVGGPTHAHGMSRARTREAAAKAAHEPDSELALDPDAEGPGLREWFDSLGQITTHAAAFDTRIHMPALIAGRASKGIARRLRQHGFTVLTDPKSFVVTTDNHLEVDEKTRARNWGARLAEIMATTEHGSVRSSH